MTDYGEGDNEDFILSPRTYSKLALPHVAHELFAFGVVDVEYKRVSCQYAGHNVMYKVHERSKYPNYLALVVTHVAGQNDITRVELYLVCITMFDFITYDAFEIKFISGSVLDIIA